MAEESVVTDLLDKNFCGARYEEFVFDCECSALASTGWAGDEVASNNLRLHPPVVILAHVSKAPPDTWVIGFVILVVAGLKRKVAGDLNTVCGADVFEIRSRGVRIVPHVGCDRLVIKLDVHLSVALMEGELGLEQARAQCDETEASRQDPQGGVHDSRLFHCRASSILARTHRMRFS